MPARIRDKILIVTSGFPLHKEEGLNMFMYELAKAQTANYEVFILAPKAKNSLAYEEWDGMRIYRHAQFPLFPVELAYHSGILGNIKENPLLLLALPFFILMQILAILRLLVRHHIRIVQAHWVLPQGFTTAVCKKFFFPTLKIISVAHGSDLKVLNNFVIRIFRSFALRSSDAIITVSEEIKTIADTLGYREKTFYCPLGIDTEKFSPTHRDPALRATVSGNGPILLFVGALIPIKGIKDLLEAVAILKEKIPDVVLWIVGTGYLEDELRSMCSRLRINTQVLFLGTIHNDALPRYFATADLFILPSYSEGFPVVVKEAMSSGIPTLVSDLPSYRSDNKLDEILYKVPAGSPTMLAEKMLTILNTTEDLAPARKAMRDYVLQHASWKTLRDTYYTITNSLSNNDHD